MANGIIKQIDIGTEHYEVYDEYARRRLEGLTNVYSISCRFAHASGYTYVDFKTGEDVDVSVLESYNGDFESTATTINIPGTHTLPEGKTGYIVLTSTKEANKYYAFKLTELELGDTIYVVEDRDTAADRWLSSYQTSPLSGTFTALDEKIDLKEYAKKTEAGKAGTYTSSAASTETSGSAGAQTATGTASVTYKKADTATGSAGGETITSSTAGAVSISYKPAGTIGGSQTVSAHSHTVNAATSSFVYKEVQDSTQNAGAHTHSVTVSGSISLGQSEVTVAETGTVTYTPAGSVSQPSFSGGEAASAGGHTHTITLATASIMHIDEPNTDSAGAHSHTVDSHTHGNNVTVATNASASGTTSAVTGITTTASTAVTGLTSGSFYVVSPTVGTDGILHINATTLVSGGSTASFLQSASAASTATVVTGVTYSTASVAGAKSAATLTTSEIAAHTHELSYVTTTVATGAVSSVSTAGAHTHSVSGTVSKPTFTGTGVRLVSAGGETSGTMTGTASSAGDHAHDISIHSSTTITYVTGATLDTAGEHTINGSNFSFSGTTATLSQAGHTHTITTSGHTHSIGLTDATATGDASVAVSNHTHSIGHTHTTTIPNCNS